MDEGFSRNRETTTMTTYPLTAAEHLAYWTALRNHFAAKCSAARISGDYPAQFGAWEAEVRRADVRLHMLAR